ncbi:MAG: DoxX family protein [Actinobacteria bacterium]|nr:DoxX family protein [Actinomycetota bacterium]
MVPVIIGSINDHFTVAGLDLGLTILRVVVGVTLAMHGLNKIFGGGKIPGTAGWFESMGVRPGLLNAWMAALTEIGSGALLALGLLTPLAAGGMLAIMVVAGITAHRGNGFFIFNAGGGYEYVLVLGAVALCLGATGAGKWSLDSVLGLELYGITPGFVITAIAGFGGAALQLAAFWRPGSVKK